MEVRGRPRTACRSRPPSRPGTRFIADEDVRVPPPRRRTMRGARTSPSASRPRAAFLADEDVRAPQERPPLVTSTTTLVETRRLARRFARGQFQLHAPERLEQLMDRRSQPPLRRCLPINGFRQDQPRFLLHRAPMTPMTRRIDLESRFGLHLGASSVLTWESRVDLDVEAHLGAVDRSVSSSTRDGAPARTVTLSRRYDTTLETSGTRSPTPCAFPGGSATVTVTVARVVVRFATWN